MNGFGKSRAVNGGDGVLSSSIDPSDEVCRISEFTSSDISLDIATDDQRYRVERFSTSLRYTTTTKLCLPTSK